MNKQIDKLIINSPHHEPEYHWHYDREHRSFEKRKGHRPAGYVVATPDSKGFLMILSEAPRFTAAQPP